MTTRHTEKFRFALGDRVTVLEIERPGIVDALSVGRDGAAYRVRFWHEGKRVTEWLYAGEIALVV